METKNNQANQEFHSVEFMRKVRTELTEQFLQDKQKYLNYLKQVMTDFKLKQKKAEV